MAYTKISASEIPSNVKWDMAAREGGQIIQTETSDNHTIYRRVGKQIRCLPVYHRVTDRSDNTVTYWVVSFEPVCMRE